MKEKDILRLKALYEKLQNYIDHPWTLRHRPFYVVGNVYLMRNNYASSFLIDGEKGSLLLIDCASQETAYLLFDSICVFGFDPANIRRLSLSHGHVDYCGAIRLVQEYSGCEVFLGKCDHFLFTEHPDLILFEKYVPRFPIHHFYEYDKPIIWGSIPITPVLTPGYTSGTTSFLIRIPYRGDSVTCTMRDGIGINGLSREELTENRLPLTPQQEFLNLLERMKKEKVEVILALHAHQYNMLECTARDDGIGVVSPGDGTGWSCMMEKHIALVREPMEE